MAGGGRASNRSASSSSSSTSVSNSSRGASGANDQNQTQRNVRARTILSPLDNTPVSRSIFNRCNIEVKLSDLANDDKIFDLNLNKIYLDVELLRIITPAADLKANIYQRRNKAGNSNGNQIPFHRIFLCRVHSSQNLSENSKLLYLMESKGSNETLFDHDLQRRDNGTITIGSFFKIVAPLPIENNMKGDIPLIKTQTPLVLLKPPSTLPTIDIDMKIQENSSMAFVLNGLRLWINRTVAVKTTCSGFLCDKQRINDWSGTRGCGCYHMTQFRTNLAFQHSVYFNGPNGKICHSDFSSHQFSKLYLKKDIPGETRVSALQNTDAYWNIEDSISNLLSYVNDNGGWTITGWYKRGVITDKSLLAASSGGTNSASSHNNNNERIEVGAGEVNFHIVKLLPTDQDILESEPLSEIKYDVDNIN